MLTLQRIQHTACSKRVGIAANPSLMALDHGREGQSAFGDLHVFVQNCFRIISHDPQRGRDMARTLANVADRPAGMTARAAAAAVHTKSSPQFRGVSIVLAPEDGRVSPTLIEELRRPDALAHIITYSPAMPRGYHRAALARAGVDAFVVEDRTGNPQHLGLELTRRLKHVLPRRVADAVCGTRNATNALALEGWCLRNAFRPLQVAMIADHFSIDRKTAYRHARTLGWKDAETLIAVARAVYVALYLADTLLDGVSIAKRLQFPDPPSLHHFTQRMFGSTPLTLRFHDPLMTAMALWRGRRAIVTNAQHERSAATPQDPA